MNKLDFLRNILARDGEVTSWHWNDGFWEFWNEFYDGKSLDQARRALSYNMRKLVACGDAHPSQRSGVGAGGGWEFGVNFMTAWRLKNFKLREDYINNRIGKSE